MQRVLPAFVGKIRDPLPIRRPCRIPLGHAGRMGQVADISFFGRYRQDLAAHLKHGAHSRWRNSAVVQTLRHFFIMCPSRRQITGNANRHLRRFAALRIEQINSAELFVDQRVRPSRQRFQVQPFVVQHLLYRLGFRVIREQAHRTVAVGKEINRVAEPHRMRIVGVFPRDFLQRQVAEFHDIDRRGLPALVALPRSLPLQVGHVGDSSSIRRKPSFLGAPHRQDFGPPALHGHGVQAVKIAVGFSARIEQHALAVGRPADHHVSIGMPGQPPRFTTGCRDDEGIHIAVVLPAERNPIAVGRKDRLRLMSASGELARFPALARHTPQVAAPNEDHLRAA